MKSRGNRPAPPGPGIPAISDAEFNLFQALIHREAGIYLSPAKKPLLVGRLMRRLKELGLRSFGSYYRAVTENGDATELIRLLDCICTNETHFFREPRQFEFLEREVFPRWEAPAGAGPRRIRVWSAACSTGEEPYSLAMAVLSRFPPATGVDVEILASDLSTRALERARAGVWRIEKAAEIPERHRRAFMLRGTGSRQGQMKAGPELRRVIRFQRHNLHAERWPALGRFDLVLCRNVLIYFDAPTKARVVERLLDHLLPGGCLLLGHAEGLHGLTPRAQAVGPTAYVRSEPAVRTSAGHLCTRAGGAA